MDRIVLEVDSKVARAWRAASSQLKEKLEKSIEVLLAEQMRTAEKDDFNKLLQEARTTAAANGMTQEILEKLLNED